MMTLLRRLRALLVRYLQMVILPGGVLKNAQKLRQIFHHFAFGLFGVTNQNAGIFRFAGQFVMQRVQIRTVIEGKIQRFPKDFRRLTGKAGTFYNKKVWSALWRPDLLAKETTYGKMGLGAAGIPQV